MFEIILFSLEVKLLKWILCYESLKQAINPIILCDFELKVSEFEMNFLLSFRYNTLSSDTLTGYQSVSSGRWAL